MNNNENKRTYKVYKHIFPNGKVYIGYRGQDEMFNAIIEHGWRNIKHEILHDNLTKEEASVLEIEEIKQHKSYLKEFGYNKLIGSGKGSMQNETIEKIRNGKIGENNHMYGKHLTAEHKKKIRDTRRVLGYEPVNKRRVLCVDTGTIYESTAEATRETGVHNSSIRRVCYGKRKTAGGYHWRYLD